MKIIKDAVYDVFMFAPEYKEMDLDDIALEIQDRFSEWKDADLNELRRKISSFLANATTKIVKGKRVEDKESLYQRVKNGKGGYKKGKYKLRKPKKHVNKPIVKPISDEIPTSTNTMFIGKAGEMAVCSELLFREFYASAMTVDDGVDIVALKNDKTFYIQVKTVQIKSNENFSIRINTNSYDRYNRGDCFYIFVARGEQNKFIVATAHDIWRWTQNGHATRNDKNITITFSQNMGSLFVKEENINSLIDAFDIIK